MDIRSYFNSFKNADLVEGITETPLQCGYINSKNMFNMKSTSQTAIIFEKDYSSITLLPQVNRGAKAATQGKERKAETFALELGYFKHADRLTGDDIQTWRQVGRTDDETLARATAEKMEDMKRAYDQTMEYMKLRALQGVSKSPDGIVMADMYTEFGATQATVDFVLGTSTTNVDAKIRELKNTIAKNVKTGGAISGIEVLVDPSFFNKLISHPAIKNAYQYFAANTNILRDSESKYMPWGVMDWFTHQGVTFVSYDFTFNLPNGTQEVGLAADTGIAYAQGIKDLFRGYHGPSAKLSGANQPGQELYVRSYVDDRDEYVEFEMETAPLFVATRPASIVKPFTSN